MAIFVKDILTYNINMECKRKAIVWKFKTQLLNCSTQIETLGFFPK